MLRKRFLAFALIAYLLVMAPFAYSQEQGAAPSSQSQATPETPVAPGDVAPGNVVPENITPGDLPPEEAVSEEAAPENAIDGFPVTLGNQEIFVIQVDVNAFSAAERSRVISTRLAEIAEDSSLDINQLEIEAEEQVSNLVLDQKVIVTLTEADAKAARQSRDQLAQTYRDKIVAAIVEYQTERSSQYLIRSGIYTAVATLALILSFIILNQIFPRIERQIDAWRDTRIPSLKIQKLELLPAQQVTNIFINVTKLIRWVIILTILNIYIPLVLGFFPWTEKFANSLFDYLFGILGQAWATFVGYLPNLLTLGFVILIAFYAVKLTRFVFTELEQGRVTIPGFYVEWAEPTSKLLVFLIVALAAVIGFPYLPGFDSPAFQGVTLFFGLLFSLGSTAAVANTVAGVILIYTRSFQIGDRVQIADAIGDIEEKTLLVTRIRTPKNVLITIPNAAVLSSNIINFSASVRDTQQPLVLHTTITLGYDVPWRLVHQVLIAAAEATTGVLADPPPFVLQTGLNDFYVSYELNAYTEQSHQMPRIYSELHGHIQDHCNEADIEILSPHYGAIRDGHHTTIPQNYLPQGYQPPSFRVGGLDQVLGAIANPGKAPGGR